MKRSKCVGCDVSCVANYYGRSNSNRNRCHEGENEADHPYPEGVENHHTAGGTEVGLIAGAIGHPPL